jgi:hypothetical protein
MRQMTMKSDRDTGCSRKSSKHHHISGRIIQLHGIGGLGCAETIYLNAVLVRADHPNRAHQKPQYPNGCCQDFELR